MATEERKAPKLWTPDGASTPQTPAGISDDALRDIVLYERAVQIERMVMYAAVRDMLCRTRKGERVFDVVVERLVRNALSRTAESRKADEEDVDEVVEEELDATASRIAHDIALTGDGGQDDEHDQYMLAFGLAKRAVLEKAREELSAPLTAQFPRGTRREVQTVRNVLSANRRERYSRAAAVLRR